MGLSKKTVEHVLGFPSALLERLGHFQGISTEIERYFEAITAPGTGEFRPRDAVEDDPTFKQIIPYVILRHEDRVFRYVRGRTSGEARLRRLGSIGVGGHINPVDANLFALDSFYRAAVAREIAEEIDLGAPYTDRVVALINDDSNPVGQVHFGVVHVFDLASPVARAREAKLADGAFVTVVSLRDDSDLEGWSRLCSDALLDGRIPAYSTRRSASDSNE